MSDSKSQIFKSVEFPDEKIFAQLQSLDHQVLLKDHGPWLSSFGPCVVTLAAAICSSTTRLEAINGLKKFFLDTNKELDPAVCETLCNHSESVLEALRIVAESYLARSGRALPSWGDGSSASELPNVVLKGEQGSYRPMRYLARGSAGLVYAAAKDDKEDYVVKRVYPTQYDSAINEYKIASRLRGCNGCLSYVDCIQTWEKEIWLVLPLVKKSEKYGVDLREYVSSGFFQEPGREGISRRLVIQLLEGLHEVSSRGIIMRDVKPDNVLIRQNDDGTYEAFWTDFGLAVDLGPKYDGTNLRKVKAGASAASVQDDFVCWWYDTCKLVPRPKWQARRPPERGFSDPKKSGGCHTFDTYMTGIIFACMAIGIDLPHIDQGDCKSALEKILGHPMEKDYLKAFELGHAMDTESKPFLSAFVRTFGDSFGSALFGITQKMLSLDPAARPTPAECLEQLHKVA